MDYEKIRRIVGALYTIQIHTKMDILEIVESLKGLAWDDEEAGEIRQWIKNH